VEVVYALPERQVLVTLDLPGGATVAQAVAHSGLIRRFPEIDGRPLACAIYSRPVSLDHVLSAQDRVEILRPLLIDPKENRRQAAARNRAAAKRS